MTPRNPLSIFSGSSLPPALAGAMAMLCFAGTFIVVRDVAGLIPPAAITFLRCLFAIVILYALHHRSLHAQWPLMRKHWKLLALQGVLIVVGGNGLMFLGLQFTTAINGSLINSAEPVAIVAVAWLMFRDRLTALQLLGVLISLAGVLYLIGRGDPAVLIGFDLNVGDIFVLASIICWAFYTVLMRRVPKEIDRLNFVFGIQVAGAIAVFPFWVLENIFYQPTPLIWTTLWVGAGLAVFSSILALSWLNRAVEGLGASRAGLLLHLIPVFTVIMAIWFLGEAAYLFHAVGIGLIAIGIYLTTILTADKKE